MACRRTMKPSNVTHEIMLPSILGGSIESDGVHLMLLAICSTGDRPSNFNKLHAKHATTCYIMLQLYATIFVPA